MIGTVVTAGVSTVQDGGRLGYADVGVPASGAWHRERYLLAVGLLNGRPDDRMPVIELLAGTLVVEVHVDTVVVVVGPAVVSIDETAGAAGACLAIRADQRIRVEHQGPGPVCVAIHGWAPDRVLGSASTDTFGGLGPPPLTAGMRLDGHPTAGAASRVGAFHRELRPATGAIRVLVTSHPAAAAFVGCRWTVTSVARSGVRLTGEALVGAGDLPSMPMVTGAVQLTPSGDPVVLGPDGGLTGGYPVVAVVASADLDRMSLAVPGDVLAFRACDHRQAVAAYADRAGALASAIAHPGLLG